ncbi:MAG: hypothetical protein HZB25_12885 [Candidatus Eisenbacteria bacterium]|nr:hypothetical protein [Candidatus Eisenbacteria bacterium]
MTNLTRFCLLLTLLAVASASLAAPRRQGRAPRRAQRPDTTATARAAADSARPAPVAEPVDSLALAWADSILAAHGGPAAWDSLLDLCYTGATTQYGKGVAERTVGSRRFLKLGPGGPMYRVEARSDSGTLLVFGCTPVFAWAYEDFDMLTDPAASRHARQQLTLDLFLFGLPWRLRQPGVTLHDAGEADRAGHSVHLLDVDVAGSPDLWRIGMDAATHLVVEAEWWHYERGAVPPRTRIELSEFTTVAGMRWATRRRIFDGADGKLLLDWRASEFRANAGIEDRKFSGR